MKNKFILVWETQDHETKTKEGSTLLELYRFALQNSISGEYFKQVQVKVIEG